MARLKTRIVPQFDIDIALDDELNLVKDVVATLPTKRKTKFHTVKGEVMVTPHNRYVYADNWGHHLVNQDYI